MNVNNRVYGMYRGDKFVAVGTLAEIAKTTGIKRDCLMSYLSPCRREKMLRQPYHRRTIFIELEEE